MSMCQYNSKKLNKWSTIVYRVYVSKNGCDFKSYYNDNELPEIGVTIEKNSHEPFHAWKSKKHLKLWLSEHNVGLYKIGDIRIFKCKLSGNLLTGDWMEEIKTVTGNNLTVLEDITDTLNMITFKDYIKQNFTIETQRLLFKILKYRLNDSIYNKFSKKQFIMKTFTWYETPQGHNYWKQLFLNLNA